MGELLYFYRLVGKSDDVRKQLIEKGLEIFKSRGYTEAHVTVPEEDIMRQDEYLSCGFTKGNPYRWMWKKI